MKDGIEYCCFCDLDDGYPADGCVIDDPQYAGPQDCIHAKKLVDEGKTKWDCSFWGPQRTSLSKEEIISITMALMDGLRALKDPINNSLLEELEACLNRHGICHKCGQSFVVHNDDGSCIED